MKVKLVWRIATLYSHVQLISGGDREYGETLKRGGRSHIHKNLPISGEGPF
jgi:hypothetical protein